MQRASESQQVKSTVEGVTQFDCRWQPMAPPAVDGVKPLILWRDRLRAADVIGQQADRYGGVGFGNLSRRLSQESPAFAITGTQTGGLRQLCAHDFAVVTAVDVRANRVVAHGHRAPSSEAMTHAMAYQADARIHWVMHGHCPSLWWLAKSRASPLPMTCIDESVGYGTPAMADAVAQILASQPRLPLLIAMLGHEDGIIALGTDATTTGECFLAAINQAKAVCP